MTLTALYASLLSLGPTLAIAVLWLNRKAIIRRWRYEREWRKLKREWRKLKRDEEQASRRWKATHRRLDQCDRRARQERLLETNYSRK